MKDPQEPEHEPESEELRTLLHELQAEQPTGGDKSPRRAAGASTREQAESPARRPDASDTTGQRAWDAAERAWLAAQVLIHATPHNPERQRALGLADAALGPERQLWLTAVEALLQALPPEQLVTAWIRSLQGWLDSDTLGLLAAAAVAQLPTIAPYVDALAALQQNVFALRPTSLVPVLQAAPVDAALSRLLTLLVQSLGQRSEEEQRAIAELVGTVAQKRRELAGALAARARTLRELPPRQQYHHQRELQALALAVRIAGLPELGPTATLGLTIGSGAAVKEWAQALARCDAQECVRRLFAPEHGLIGRSFGLARGIDIAADAIAALPPGPATEAVRRSLLEHPDPELRLEVAYRNPDLRRRVIEVCAILSSLDEAPGWVTLYPQRDKVLRFMREKYTTPDWSKLARRYGRPLVPLTPPLTPLQAATSRYTDLRHRALRNLAAAGDPEHLLAALLAADLDRALESRGYPSAWRFAAWGRWPKLQLAQLDFRWSGRGLTGLLLVVRRLNQLGLLGEQRLSPELGELQRVGTKAYADRYPAPERLAGTEQAKLAAQEAAFIASATDRPN